MVFISYYDNGKVKSESYWINHNNDNSQAFVGFYDNGNKQSEIYYINGKLHNINGPAIIKYNIFGDITKKDWYFCNNKIDGIKFNSIIKNISKEDLKAYIMIHYWN